MEKLLITGINGFVGSQLNQYLKNDFEVWGLDIQNANNQSNFIESDIADKEKINDDLKNLSFDYIIHCAAIAHNDKNKFSAADFEKVNSLGTYNILYAIEDNPPKKFILFSTVAVYGEYGFNGSIDETYSLNPITDYAKSKVKAEQYCQGNSIVNTIITRFPVIYSESFLKDFSKRIFQKGKLAFRFGSGKQQHIFCHIDTVKEQISFLLQKEGINNEVFQMGDDFSYMSNDILKYFKKDVRIVIPFPKLFFKTLIEFVFVMIPTKKNTFRSIYWKLFANNLYSIEKLKSIGYETNMKRMI